MLNCNKIYKLKHAQIAKVPKCTKLQNAQMPTCRKVHWTKMPKRRKAENDTGQNVSMTTCQPQ